MRYGNIDLLTEELERIESKKIDKDYLMDLIKKCETDPFRDLLIRIIKETR